MGHYIDTNLTPATTQNDLGSHYGSLQTSMGRLLASLCVNFSADEAAGLAIRKLMRADLGALNQGAKRNCTITYLLQMAGGALDVVDEQFAHIKGLAKQTSHVHVSDADLAAEMTQFVRNRTLTHSTMTMLGKAPSMPRMALNLMAG